MARTGSLLRTLQALEASHLAFLTTLEDRRLVFEIALRQDAGRPLPLSDAFRLGGGSVATIQRQVRRLRAAGVIEQVRAPGDRRVAHLVLAAKTERAIRDYLAGLRAAMPRP